MTGRREREQPGHESSKVGQESWPPALREVTQGLLPEMRWMLVTSFCKGRCEVSEGPNAGGLKGDGASSLQGLGKDGGLLLRRQVGRKAGEGPCAGGLIGVTVLFRENCTLRPAEPSLFQ